MIEVWKMAGKSKINGNFRKKEAKDVTGNGKRNPRKGKGCNYGN